MTWNVNSVRLRAEQCARLIIEQGPDVLCLQEIKCQAAEFPYQAFADVGLPHVLIHGQKGWHGTAIVSRLPLEPGPDLGLCRRGEARATTAIVAGVPIWNFYIPAGGDLPDRQENDKFDHKLEFYERLTKLLAARDPNAPLIVAGDLNIAPLEHDVWSHKQMLKVVSHTPPELEAFAAMMQAGRFLDLPRLSIPEPHKLFSWWSYRAADFRASNRGLRLDHILASPGLRDAVYAQGSVAARVHEDVRAWERPSDHAPVSADIIV